MDRKELLKEIEAAREANRKELDLSWKGITELPFEISQLTSLEKLDLSNNQLANLPADFGNLTSLEILSLSGNQLAYLPPEFGTLANLVNLFLSDNQLAVPAEIVNLTSLEQLDLSGNRLTTLPAEFGSLTNLVNLDLGANRLTSLPAEFGNLTNLKTLVLSGNRLTDLPSEFGNLRSLEDLDLSEFVAPTSSHEPYSSGNQLTDLPPEFGNLANLETLGLSGNQLARLPTEFGALMSLKVLHLSGNRLATLPSEIGNLTSLKILDLSGNKLTHLPFEFGRLTDLWRLFLSDNQLADLPAEIVNLTSLEQIDLSGNRLTTLPAEFGNCTSLEILFLSGNQLTSLPSGFGNLTHLTRLYLSDNELTSLPSGFGNLTNLEILFLSGNQLTNLPAEFDSLANLNELDLSGNQLTNLPSGFGALTSLWELDLSGNQLTNLPSGFGDLRSLWGLDLSGNQLNNLPPGFGKLTHLGELDLSGNQLANLPVEFGKLINLKDLDLSGNQLNNLPPGFGKLTNLKDLDLSGNQLNNLPPGFGKLTNLEELDLSGNQLTDLSVEFGNLSGLRVLVLSENRLTALPPEFFNLAELEELYLTGNHLTTLYAEFERLTNLRMIHVHGNPFGAIGMCESLKRINDLNMAEGLKFSVPIYGQDPLFAKDHPIGGIVDIDVIWEPGLTDGPTSATIAVVDYDGDTGELTLPVRWDDHRLQFFLPNGNAISKRDVNSRQFYQVNVWAITHRILRFFENRCSMGRTITWGFEGNRLIILPHAGYGENAFYDHGSKSLQFYYYGRPDDLHYTCLSHDIVAHETGHAVLDGIRPHFYESTSLETSAFHEYIGDFTAFISTATLRAVREALTLNAPRERSEYVNYVANRLGEIAEEFGTVTRNEPSLRSLFNEETMSVAGDISSPHRLSQIMSGAMFEVFLEILRSQLDGTSSYEEVLRDALGVMTNIAFQPLDFLPAVDVRFSDYALAVLRAGQLPALGNGHGAKILEVFHERGILDKRTWVDHPLLETGIDFYAPPVIESISRSRGRAYRFLHENRRSLFIPAKYDIAIAGLYHADKLPYTSGQLNVDLVLRRETVLEYLWREDVRLEGPRFGRLNGHSTTMPCGGTLVFDEDGNVLSWLRKPGSEYHEGPLGRTEAEMGQERREEFLNHIATQVEQGRLGLIGSEDVAYLHRWMPPVTAQLVDGTLRFISSPHSQIGSDEEDLGGRRWEISF